jgi:hypothetical protein
MLNDYFLYGKSIMKQVGQAAVLWTCIQDVLSSKSSQDTNYPNQLLWFS